MTINHLLVIRNFFRCIEHCRADMFLITYIVFYIPLKYILPPGLFHDFFYRDRDVHHIITMTFFAWHRLCFLYHWNISYTSHVDKLLTTLSLNKVIAEVMFCTYNHNTNYCTEDLRSLNNMSFKIIDYYKHYWYALSIIWWQHQRRKINYFFGENMERDSARIVCLCAASEKKDKRVRMM